MPDDVATLPEVAIDIATVLGWPVLPIWPLTPSGHCACPKGRACDRSPGKHPANPDGLTGATTDPTLIGGWWARWPSAGIGVRCDHLLVVDCDEHPDDPGVGWRNWLQVAEPYGWQVTDTLVCATRSQGVHIYYQLPDQTLDGSGTAAGIATKVDTRYHDNYVIVSPTPGYEIIHDAALPDAPAWLTDHITTIKQRPRVPVDARPPAGGPDSVYGLRALEGELGRLAQATDGTRNDTLVRAAYRAGQLAAGHELDPIHAARQLEAVALRIGLSPSEVASTIRSGMTAGAQQPRRSTA